MCLLGRPIALRADEPQLLAQPAHLATQRCDQLLLLLQLFRRLALLQVLHDLLPQPRRSKLNL